jgi:polysaccharide export outer membrane protein
MSLRSTTLLVVTALLLGGCAQSHLDEMASDFSSIGKMSAAGVAKPTIGDTGEQRVASSDVDVIYDKPATPAGDATQPVKTAWGDADVQPAEKAADWGETSVNQSALPKISGGETAAKKSEEPLKVADGWGADTRRMVSPAPVGPPPRAMMAAPAPVVWGPGVVVQAALTGGPTGHEPYILDTGDRLRVFVYGQPNLSRLYTVDQIGNIAVPLIGSVQARGRTTIDLERAIASRLGRQFVKDPQVTVDVAQNRPFFILGEVRMPGQFPFVSGMTVEQAVAIGGGYTERASKRSYRITRKLGPLVDQIEAPGDYPLCPGDTVFVYERFF